MIADSNGDRSGDTRPLWITGLSPPDSWWSLRQPGYLQLDQVRTPKHCVWGYDRTLKVRNFRSTKVGNFQSQLTDDQAETALTQIVALKRPFAVIWRAELFGRLHARPGHRLAHRRDGIPPEVPLAGEPQPRKPIFRAPPWPPPPGATQRPTFGFRPQCRSRIAGPVPLLVNPPWTLTVS